MKTAIEQGMADAWADFAGVVKQVDDGKVTSGDLFGTRALSEEQLPVSHGRAVLGIWGNSKQEAMYPVYRVDADGQKLDGGQPLHLALCAGPTAARQRVLVADDV